MVEESYDLINSKYKWPYESIEAPVLGIFAERFLAPRADPVLAESVDRWNQRFSIPGQEIAKERFRNRFKNVRVITYEGTSHDSLLLMDPQRLSNDIRVSLGGA